MTERGAPPERSLADLLRDWNADALHLSHAREPMQPARIRRACEEVVRQLGDLTPRTPPAFELESLERTLRSAWQKQRTLALVPPRDLRRAPWVFFFPKRDPDRWLAADSGFVNAWLRWFDSHRRSRVIVTLLREFLAAYPTESSAFESIRRTLERLVHAGGSPRLQLWRDRSARYGLLEPDGPSRLLDRWWTSDVGFDEYLRGAGLAPGLEGSTFVAHASRELLVHAKARLGREESDRAWLERSFAWLRDGNGLRFDGLRVDTAAAFLDPFVERSPQPDVRDAIRGFLCGSIGDPRIQRGRWQGIPDPTRNVLFRWLVSLSLDAFFQVLDQTAYDRHWRYRRAFWTAYLEREFISDAWIILGPKARRLLRRSIEVEGMGASQLLGALSDQSVLLMRIGGMTIAEWSHSGSCRFWSSDNADAPSLYQSRYTKDQLMRGANWYCAHHSSDRGGWQDAASGLLERETGIRVARGAYMPSRNRGSR